MDKLKGVAKGGWHPPGDRSIHRDTWKKDLRGMATGKKNDPNEAARNHQSAPLTTLRDPDTFGAPPRHSGVSYDHVPASPSSPARAKPPPAPGGWGASVPAPRQRAAEVEEEAAKPPSGPYKTDTTGLRTDHLPPPPGRRADGPMPPTPPRTGSVPTPPPTLPSRHPAQQTQPAPVLPPRMNEHPDEYTPPPPPPYHEAAQPAQDPAAVNAGAVIRLGQARVSVPAFGIGGGTSATPPQSPAAPGHSGQLSELQQRFARMNPGSNNQEAASNPLTSSPAASAAQKKPPPPPPPKKAGLSGSRPSSSDAGSAPPPLPMSSKPRPPM